MYVEWMRVCGGMSDMDVCGVDENVWGMSDMDVCGVDENMWGNESHGCVWRG